MLLSNGTDCLAPKAAAERLSAATHATQSEFRKRIEAQIPFLRRAARRWQRQPADLEDLVHDTLLQALANAHLWQPGTDLRAWLYTIMRNRFLAGTARSARSAASLAQLGADPRPQAPAGELGLLLRDVAAALRRLPSSQRSAVILIGVEGKSYNEAAQTMGTSVGAVRSHLARGRDRLRSAVRGSDARTPFSSRPTPRLAAAGGPLAAPDAGNVRCDCLLA